MGCAKNMLFCEAALLLSLATASCEVFSDSCPPVQPEVMGIVDVDLNIRENFVRRCEAPIGDFLADALLHYDYGLKDAPNVRAALFYAGAIRDRIECGKISVKRESIPRGPISDQDLMQALPDYEDMVVVVKLTGGQLKSVLERAVSALGPEGQESAQSYFLHASGDFDQEGKAQIKFKVDCNSAPQKLTTDGKTIDSKNPGDRVSGICIGKMVPCFEPLGSYYVVTQNNLVEKDLYGVPNFGFVTFHEPTVTIFYTPVRVIDVVQQWLATYRTVRKDSDYPQTEGRIEFLNCAHASECGNPG